MSPAKSAADIARENARKVRQRREPAPPTPSAPTEPEPQAGERPVTTSSSSSKLRTRRVRRTVDLTVNRHRELGRWCDEQADELGLTRVTSQDVLSALVDELLVNPDVQRVIQARIRDART